MIIPGLLGAVHAWMYGFEKRYFVSYVALLRKLPKQKELIHTINFILIIVVGIGSLFFHMTLRYEMQLLDELPMVYGSCVLVYAL